MEFIVTYAIYVINRWWITLPLLIVIYVLLLRRYGSALFEMGCGLQIAGIVVVLLLTIFARPVTVPLINYYGEYAIAKVESYRTTIFADAAYNSIDSVRASFVDNEGRERKLRYWTNVRRIYPIFKRYGIPETPGNLFIIKYLPLKPSEFVFIAKLPERDKAMVCSRLHDESAELEASKELLEQSLSELRMTLYKGLSRDESSALSRKIRRGKNLTETEQQFKRLEEELSDVNRKIRFIKRTIEDDDFCEE